MEELAFGVISTTLTQSSSLVSVITISFLSAELIGLRQVSAFLAPISAPPLVPDRRTGPEGEVVRLCAAHTGIRCAAANAGIKAIQGAGLGTDGIGLPVLGIDYMKEGFPAFPRPHRPDLAP